MYKYLFGPVPSRRLGTSLGVDLVPKKVCSLDCVYCEVGKTTVLTLDRKEYVKLQEVKDELLDFFKNNPDPDFITFSGYGEPTLNVSIGEILNFIKKEKPNIPLAVLTNGTLFYDKNVRDSILNADLVLPSLDAATKAVFRIINRPCKKLNIEKYIEGLVNFRKEYKGKIWLEVFILPGYNDHENELNALKEAILRINPNSVQLNTLDRPGSVRDLTSMPRKKLEEIKEFWGIENVEIIASSSSRKNNCAYKKDVESLIVQTIKRRPCTIEDLSQILGLSSNEINKYLDVLEKDKRIQTVNQDRGIFYTFASNSKS